MTRSLIVQLLVTAGISPLNLEPAKADADKCTVSFNEREDYEFLVDGKGNSEETE
jgi:hypothetical protein